jgi:outer membrane protein assembly factor BamB
MRVGNCRLWLLLTFSFLASPLSLTAADWFNWRGPWQNGTSPDTGLPSKFSLVPGAPDGNLIWKAPYGSRSTPLVLHGRVYLINYAAEKTKDSSGAMADVPETIQERVLCLDANTGKLIWEYKFNVWHTDIVTVRLGWTNLAADPETGNVYAHGTQGMLICFNKDGKVLWDHSLSEEYGRITGYGGRVTSPVIDEDRVIIGMLNSSWGNFGKGANRFVAFNKHDGKVVWWSEPAGPPKDTYYSAPVIAVIGGERLVISGGADGSVHAMKSRTGEHVWSYHFGTAAVNCAPVVEGNYVYIGQGEENPDNAERGRVVCLDGSQVKNKQPKLVWKRDGIRVRYTSPILHDGRLYVTDDIGKLYSLDAKTGKQAWKFSYGRNSRGSPVWADGKIYVGEVNSRFHILKPGKLKCERLYQQFFPSPDGVSDVEINGSPAVAGGRVFFSTGDETYCIGTKEGKGQPWTVAEEPAAKVDKATHLQIYPADITLNPGESATFTARAYDAHGNFLKEVKAEWSLPTPPLPPKAKQGPPPLKGEIADGKLTVDAKVPAQQGYVGAKAEGLTAQARVRVAPRLPYQQDFNKLPDGAVPGGWVNTQGKFLVKTLEGEKVLGKVNDKASPLVARGNAYIGEPTLTDYTIESDVRGEKAGGDLPDVGVVANRYTLFFAGNIQKLRIVSWDALPRIDRTVPFKFDPGVWYRLKLTVVQKGDSAVVKGKAWKRGEQEPADWTIEVTDSHPNREGAPALYAYVWGIPEGGPGTEIYYDNVRITPNKK